MRKQEVRSIIEKVGIVPVVRASSAEEARFAADLRGQGRRADCGNYDDGSGRSRGDSRTREVDATGARRRRNGAE